MKNNAQAKHNKRKKQNKKNKLMKTNTTSITRFANLKHFLLQIAMLGRVVTMLFGKWVAVKDSLPGFRAVCDKLKLLVDAINQKYDDYRKIIKTVAQQKKQAREALSEAGFVLMSSCRTYAQQNNMDALASKMDVNLSGLLGMKYRDLIALMNNASQEIFPLIPQADFNITQGAYDDLQSKIADAQSLENGPKSAIEQRKSIGSQLLVDTKAAMDFFNNQFLPLATNFRTNNAFWYDLVITKRIGKTDNRHSALFAHCQTEVGESVYGITVTVNEFTDPATGKTYRAASATSDPNGDAEVIEFFAGNRTVTLSGPGIETTTYPAIPFERGKAVIKTFTVKPAFNIPAPEETRQKVQG